MIVSRYAKRIGALLIVGCLTVSGGVAAMAAPDESSGVSRGPGHGVTAADRVEIAIDPVPGIDPELLAKQREIDAYLFGTGSEELAKLGFKATHTVPVDGRVEIGILPYEESHAEFLYEKFGRDRIVVVEGVEAVLLDGPMTILPAPAPGGVEPAFPGSGSAAPADGGGTSGSGGAAGPGYVPPVPEPVAPDAGGNQAGPVANPDQPVSASPDGTAVDQPAYAEPAYSASGAADAAGSAEIAVPLSADDETRQAGSLWTSPYLYAAAIAAALVLAVAVLAARRKRLTARSE